MMITRKTFIQQVTMAGAGLGLMSLRPLTSYGGVNASKTLTILHTNDTHARIDPFPAGAGEYEGLGGVARRAALVKAIRGENPHTLLLDAGDTFQGTPYFNFYHGKLDFEVMSMMGYDASTIGNHEFDNRVRGFVDVAPAAAFPFVNSNYDFTGAPEMGAFIQRYLIKTVNGLRIGIFGLGVGFDGLVLPPLHEGVAYLDPIPVSERVAHMLRNKEQCDLVVCLSHLGYIHESGQVSDLDVAAAVDGIDLIIGGHTHTLLEEPDVIEEAGRRPTIISQVGHAGVVLGRLDFEFDRNHRLRRVACVNQRVDGTV